MDIAHTHVQRICAGSHVAQQIQFQKSENTQLEREVQLIKYSFKQFFKTIFAIEYIKRSACRPLYFLMQQRIY